MNQRVNKHGNVLPFVTHTAFYEVGLSGKGFTYQMSHLECFFVTITLSLLICMI